MPEPLGSRGQGGQGSCGHTQETAWGGGRGQSAMGPSCCQMLTHHTALLQTELELVRLIKSKSWEDVWVSDGLWNAFWPPRQTAGWGAWAPGFDMPQAAEHLQTFLLPTGKAGSCPRESGGSQVGLEGPEMERWGDSVPEGLGPLPQALWFGPRALDWAGTCVPPVPQQPVPGGQRLRVCVGGRPRLQSYPCLLGWAIAVIVHAPVLGRNSPGPSEGAAGHHVGEAVSHLPSSPAASSSSRKVQVAEAPGMLSWWLRNSPVTIPSQCPRVSPSLPSIWSPVALHDLEGFTGQGAL